MGSILALETKARGALCLLAPTINIQRHPRGGRAFESFSEDPHLSGTIAAAYVSGLQSNGVSACIKHFVCNDQEHERMGQDSVVQERPLREVYLRPFQIAQKLSQPWAYMTGYNKLNGTHCSENPWLLYDLLRGEWKFEGIVISDWYGTYSVSDSINAGCNVEFPGPPRWRIPMLIKHLINAHKVDPDQIDAVVTELLHWEQNLAKLSPDIVYSKETKEKTRTADIESDKKLVHRIITEGIVLAKNEGGILPVHSGSVAIVGPNAKALVLTGGGSARLQPSWSSTPWEGFVAAKPSGVNLTYALGTTTAKFLPMFDECFTSTDGDASFRLEAHHYPIVDGKQALKPVAFDKLLRSEVRLNDFTHPELYGPTGLEYFTEIKATFTSPMDGEYEFGICVTGKGWMWVDEQLIWEATDYKVKGEAFYGNATPEAIVRIKVQKGKVGSSFSTCYRSHTAMTAETASSLTRRNTPFACCTTSAALPTACTSSPPHLSTRGSGSVLSPHSTPRKPSPRRSRRPARPRRQSSSVV